MTPVPAPSPVDTPSVRATARALLLGERLDTAGLERSDVIAPMPLTFRVGAGYATLFRYGVVVLIGVIVIVVYALRGNGSTGGAGSDTLSIGVSAKMGLVGNKTPASGTWVVFKTSVDAVDETVAGVDATYGTVSPTSAANASRKFKFFYNYSITPTQNSHTHTLA